MAANAATNLYVPDRNNGGNMQNYFYTPFEMFSAGASFIARSMQLAPKMSRAAFAQTRAAQYYWVGIFKYVTAFMKPSVNTLNALLATEKEKLAVKSPAENLEDYRQLFDLNVQLARVATTNSLKAMNGFFYAVLSKAFLAWMNTFEDEDCLSDFSSRLEEILKVTVCEYPKAVEEIKPEFGLKLDSSGYEKTAETERFDLYRVLPTQKGVTPANKPILIVPPYVLGANILAFLPGEQRSYVHCYANQGVPTYIRLVKDIYTTPAVQTMTGEDDARDIRFFCGELKARHNMPVSLNGFCQGGYLCLAALLSGELDGLVDALITCVTPVDGSRSKSFVRFLNSIPIRFREIRYSQKLLPNGNTVIDGAVLSWVQKLRKLETESPIVSFHRDIAMFDSQATPLPKISKTAAAINYWLTHDQYDLPVRIAEMSFASYSIPIDEEGALPITLFGRKLVLKRMEEKKVPWLVCIADGDDLVDKEASLTALNYIDAEVCVFPKGHASIATSWSIPTSACALHILFPKDMPPPVESCRMSRGPVRFHMDLEAAIAGAQNGSRQDRQEIVGPARVAAAGLVRDEAFKTDEDKREKIEAPSPAPSPRKATAAPRRSAPKRRSSGKSRGPGKVPDKV